MTSEECSGTPPPSCKMLNLGQELSLASDMRGPGTQTLLRLMIQIKSMQITYKYGFPELLIRNIGPCVKI